MLFFSSLWNYSKIDNNYSSAGVESFIPMKLSSTISPVSEPLL